MIVLHIDGQVILCVLVDERDDCADCLSGLATDCHRVELEVVVDCDAEQGWVAPEGQRVGVLEEDDPFFALLVPLVDHSVHVQQGVDIAVPMGFGLQGDFTTHIKDGEMRLVVGDGGDFFLPEDGELVLAHAVVIVRLEQLYSFLVGVA